MDLEGQSFERSVPWLLLKFKQLDSDNRMPAINCTMEVIKGNNSVA